MPLIEIEPEPIRPRRRRRGDGAPVTRILPGLVVAGMPIVLLVWSWLVSLSPGVPPESMPTASDPPVLRWTLRVFAVLFDPATPALAYLLMPMALPPILGAVGIGSMARWLVLAIFCGAGMVVFTTILGVAAMASTFDPEIADLGSPMARIAGMVWPLLGLETCGCLLAAGLAMRAE